jgi:hypothetical protein
MPLAPRDQGRAMLPDGAADRRFAERLDRTRLRLARILGNVGLRP